ncbi:MAG: pyridoxamine 5'-phosphate oxidase family protein [Candidatus Omnitrophica bacterium]|nr:pyridoxamine 5'-phosphate oxidase family protein [Candidatus Omnitrophota bacterium]MBU4149396.1 pyridoxamine 5'-phosphate oxidase family protein [Candidatus Omnitrophota bacterium]
MKSLSEDLVRFFHKQHYTVITTIDENGFPHNSCKGIVEIDKTGMIYLLDLYKEKTHANLHKNPNISITAVDEHKFIGYSLKGKARLVKRDKIESRTVKLWEDKITKRLSHRLIKNIKGEKGHPKHPEALLPKPEYLIEVDVEEIVDLTPHHIRHG